MHVSTIFLYRYICLVSVFHELSELRLQYNGTMVQSRLYPLSAEKHLICGGYISSSHLEALILYELRAPMFCTAQGLLT